MSWVNLMVYIALAAGVALALWGWQRDVRRGWEIEFSLKMQARRLGNERLSETVERFEEI